MKYLLLLLSFCATDLFASDSLRTETANGKFVIVHKVDPGQTLFSIARRYNVAISEVKAINPNLNQLKAGMELFIPAKTPPSTVTSSQPPASATPPTAQSEVRGTDEEHGTIHKVKQGETLFRISKMYNVPVAKISAANRLGQGGIKVGQELIIPQGNLPLSATSKTTSSTAENVSKQEQAPVANKVEKKTSATGYPSITETGMAKLDESLPSNFYTVLHKSAPIGTLVLIKSKETGNKVHARVSGPTKNGEVLVANKKVFEKLEAPSITLAVEISYSPE